MSDYSDIRKKLNALKIRGLPGSLRKEKRKTALERFETRHSIELPEEFRWLLINFGTSVFDENIVYLPISKTPKTDFTGRGSVEVFYGLETENSENSLEWNFDTYRDRMSNMMPIAGAAGGDQICLCITGAESGKILFWNHEEELLPDGTMNNDNKYLIAESCADLFKRLEIKSQTEEIPSVKPKRVIFAEGLFD